MPDPNPAEEPVPTTQREAELPQPKVRSRSLAQRIAGGLNAAYVFVFFLLLALLSWWGERHWLLSLLLFAPAYALLAPLLVLTPVCLFTRPKLLLWHLLCAVVLCFGYMEFSWTRKPEPAANVLKVVTYNAGAGDRTQFREFVAAHDPDIIALQDVRYRGASYAKTWPNRFVTGRGEFLLVTRDSVREVNFLDEPNWAGIPVAARFELDRKDGPLVVYNVHLPTPRGELRRFLSRRAISNIFGDEDHGKMFATYREWVDARIHLAQRLAAVLGSEKQPHIVCGDFNTPDNGYIHRILAEGMIDAHATAGNGWGLTFPGGTAGRAARLGPWLRIDFAYAGRGWKPVYSETDSGRRSEHRAIAAYFVPDR